MEQNNNTKQERSDCGAVWIHQNSKGADYLAIKVKLGGKEYFLKGFLNSGKVDGDSRPSFLLYPSNPTSKNFNRKDKLD